MKRANQGFRVLLSLPSFSLAPTIEKELVALLSLMILIKSPWPHCTNRKKVAF